MAAEVEVMAKKKPRKKRLRSRKRPLLPLICLAEEMEAIINYYVHNFNCIIRKKLFLPPFGSHHLSWTKILSFY